MVPRSSFRNRRLFLFMLMAASFAAGVLVERSGRLFTPYYYTPAGMEKSFAPFWETWALIDRFYVDRQAVDHEHMKRGAIQGLLNSLGDIGHTSYLTQDNVQQLKRTLEGHYEGIGARMSLVNGQPTIRS